MWLLIILALIVIISGILTYIAENNTIDFLEFFAPAFLIVSAALLLIFGSIAVVTQLSHRPHQFRVGSARHARSSADSESQRTRGAPKQANESYRRGA